MVLSEGLLQEKEFKLSKLFCANEDDFMAFNIILENKLYKCIYIHQKTEYNKCFCDEKEQANVSALDSIWPQLR